ncbi:14848_t:CDS:2 [Funneliformis geosporum]|uniref:14848_t:CDS:1 n=1 Tax=Funneliformis geosporum TaxID=1117311 RepID=A0A9W4SVX3_9GLOM|nr:14848_t:CDS:2 [Funneliformis geosporum]
MEGTAVPSQKISNQNENSPLYKFIEGQAKRFEEFGDKMSLQLHTLYQECNKKQTETLGKNLTDLENVCKTYQKQIDYQSELIDYLITRIENLEIYASKRDQDIKKLRGDFNYLLKVNKLSIGVTAILDEIEDTSTRREYEGSSLGDNVEEDEYDWNRLNSILDESANDSPLYSTNNLSSPSSQVGLNDQEDQGTISKLEEFHAQIITQNKTLDIKLHHLKSFSNSLKSVDLIRYTQMSNYKSLDDGTQNLIKTLVKEKLSEEDIRPLGSVNNVTKSMLSKEFKRQDEEEDDKVEESPKLNQSVATSSQSTQKDQDTTPKLQQLHFQIQQIIARGINGQVKLKQLKALNDSFTTNELVQYTNTNDFNSLNEQPKSIINILICDLLVREFKMNPEVFLQNPEEYIKRNVIPELPAEFTNYTEYANRSLLQKILQIKILADNNLDEFDNKDMANYSSPYSDYNNAAVSSTSFATSEDSANIILTDKADKNSKNISTFHLFVKQLWIMIKRNAILQVRYYKSTLAQIVVGPILFLFLLFILQRADNRQRLQSILHPLPYSLNGINPCQGRDATSPCINLMFTPDNDENREILLIFSTNNERRTGIPLPFDNVSLDISNVPGSNLGMVPVSSSDFIYDYTLQNPNITMFGIEFTTVEGPPKNYRYQIWLNSTLMANNSDVFSEQVLAFQRGIDEAIVSYESSEPATSPAPATFNINLKDWPKVPPTQLGNEIISRFGATFFFCANMIIFISVLNTIVAEKEAKLKDSLVMMGLKVEVYWLSYFISNAWLMVICSLITCLGGLAFGFFVFKNSNFAVLFITFLLFGLAMVAFGFFITTFCRRSRVAVLVGIFLFITGLLFESFVFSNEFVGYIWWDVGTNKAGWLVLMFVPFFNFGKIFLDISNLSSGKLDVLTQTLIPGSGFKWKNLYEKVDDKFLPSYNTEHLDLKPDVPAPIQSWYFLLMNIAFYAILTWYFDKVIPDEYGNRKSPLFFLTPSYYGIKLRSDFDLQRWLNRNEYSGVEDEDQDIAKERISAFNPEHDAALRICNLRKVYKQSIFFKSKLDKVAVKDLCLTLKESKCLALLGQNGAGKSTTINIISGAARATSGDALIYGCSVKDDIGKIRTMMGVCPQHDILFNDLTAREHIELYAGIKNIPVEEIQKLVDERLASVRLTKVADKLAGGFSGGMKRRLSMIIATIGDPKILFLDEPTTGMDPVNRRYVWSFIEKFKRGRVIILTTHSMEEADVLGDRICIMAHGSLRALGNSIRIKSKFGGGYRVSLVTRIEDSARLKRWMENIIPEATLEDDSAGSLLYELPNSALPKLPTLIDWLEENEEKSDVEPEKKLLKAWGISQKSLEEAFLRLIRDANSDGHDHEKTTK